jgi:cysteine synthase B
MMDNLVLTRKRLGQVRVAAGTDVFDLVGNTPLVPLRGVAANVLPVEVYAKAEWFNPSGSIKDGPAREIILAAKREGKLSPEVTLLDATSGNMGIAYAMRRATRGYRAKLVIPQNACPERIKILRAYGAEMVFSSPLENTDGAIRLAHEIIEKDPQRYFYADQYSNPSNWQAHYRTTGVEVWEQTAGRVMHFVAGLGTSGTFVGIGRRLREFNPNLQLITVQPDALTAAYPDLKRHSFNNEG